MPRRKHRKNPDLPKRVPVLDANNPGDTTLNLLARAAMLYVMGEPFPRIDRKLKLKRRTVNTWKGQWPEHWEAACRRAQTQIVKMVNEQMGTTAILTTWTATCRRRKRSSASARSFPAWTEGLP